MHKPAAPHNRRRDVAHRRCEDTRMGLAENDLLVEGMPYKLAAAS